MMILVIGRMSLRKLYWFDDGDDFFDEWRFFRDLLYWKFLVRLFENLEREQGEGGLEGDGVVERESDGDREGD